MTDFQTALATFEKYATENYECDGGEVWAMVQREVDRRLADLTVRKTAKQVQATYLAALSFCRGWLADERRQLTARDMYRYAPAKNYFNALIPKAKSHDPH